MKVVIGNTIDIGLSKEIVEKLNVQASSVKTSRFPDGEINVEVNNDLLHQEVLIIQSISPPVNDNLMELLLTVDAIKRVGPQKVTVIIPYYGYSRQDRVIKSNNMSSALSARLIANLLEISGINEVVTIDIHSSQIEGFFNIPITNLNSLEIFIDVIPKKDLAIVAPDIGAITRARTFARILERKYNMELSRKIVVLDKYREKASISEVLNIIGEVQNKDCIIIDDIVDSGGTLCNAAHSLKKKGAKSVTACITHGVLSGNAEEKIINSSLDKLTITNTIPLKFTKNDKIQVLSIADILTNFILRRYNAY